MGDDGGAGCFELRFELGPWFLRLELELHFKLVELGIWFERWHELEFIERWLVSLRRRVKRLELLRRGIELVELRIDLAIRRRGAVGSNATGGAHDVWLPRQQSAGKRHPIPRFAQGRRRHWHIR
jgi:hypothetical protein